MEKYNQMTLHHSSRTVAIKWIVFKGDQIQPNVILD